MAAPHDPRDLLPRFLRPYCPSQQKCREWSAGCRSFMHGFLKQLWRGARRRWQQLDRKWQNWSVCAVLAAVLLPLLFVKGSPPPPSTPTVNNGYQAAQSPVSSSQVAVDDKPAQPTKEADKAPKKRNNAPRKPYHIDVPKKFQGPTPAPWPLVAESDPLLGEAYLMQRRFVLESFYLSAYHDTIVSVQRGSNKSGFSPPDDTKIVRNGNLFRVRGWTQHDPGVRVGYDGPGTKDDELLHTDYLLEMQYDPDLEVWHLLGRVEKIN